MFGRLAHVLLSDARVRPSSVWSCSSGFDLSMTGRARINNWEQKQGRS